VNSFLVSAAVVAVAEIGDKTQLLALVLAAKFRKPIPIILGILVATLANHAAAAAIGTWLTLRRLVGWLEGNGHAAAAASLREGLEETLTVLKLELPPRLRRFFATTNAIENLIGTLRHVARNVKRWRNGTMIRRWVGLGVLRAAARFRRIKGHGDLAVLATALRPAAAGEQAA